MRRPFTIGLAGAVAVAALAAGAVQFSSAAFVSNSSNRANAVTAKADWSAPVAGSFAIAKSTGGVPGFIRQGGSYAVYANVADAGNPASGASSVTADVSALTGGQIECEGIERISSHSASSTVVAGVS